jgi:hypothetical protein
MNAHNCVVADAAHQPSLLPIVRAQVIVIRYAIGNRKLSPNRGPIEPTSKINPLTAIAGPWLPAKRDGNAGRNQCLLDFAKMLARHIDMALAERRRSAMFALLLLASVLSAHQDAFGAGSVCTHNFPRLDAFL